jgi:cytoskeletal protein RodZ
LLDRQVLDALSHSTPERGIEKDQKSSEKRGGRIEETRGFSSSSLLSSVRSLSTFSSNLALLVFLLFYRFLFPAQKKSRALVSPHSQPAVSLTQSRKPLPNLSPKQKKAGSGGDEMGQGGVKKGATADAAAVAPPAEAAAPPAEAAAPSAANDEEAKPLARRAAARRVASLKEPTASDGEFFVL